MTPDPPDPQPAESAADVLDRELANTKREAIVTTASVAVAVTGGLFLTGALQLWSAVWLAGLFEYVPWALLALGVALLFLGSRIYSQRLRAVLGAIVLAAIGTLGSGAWALVTMASGFLSLIGVLMPLASLTAAILAGLAWGPCARTAAARRRAAAAGLDLNL
jgi:hypothetical protein